MDYRERWELKDYLVGQTLGRRILLFHAALVFLLLAFLLDFWYLQGVRGDEYGNLAENNRLRRIPTPPTRGAIFDRTDEVLAATRPALDLVLLREGARELDAQLRHLAPILDIPYEELVSRMDRLRRQPMYEPFVLREDVGLETLAQVEAHRELFPSVEVRETKRRSYPQGDLFGHVLGYVAEVNEDELDAQNATLDVGDIVGKTGVERDYDEILRGSRGWNLVSVNSLGRRVGQPWVASEPEHGGNIQLTLDLRLQRALKEGLRDEVGAGVFLDPWTGEVLAIGSSPAFDPSLFSDRMTAGEWKAISEDPRRPLLDRAIASFYAPGSVFKVVMAVAGLETGTVNAQESIFCNGSINLYGRRRLCWKRGGHGRVNLRQALTHSCNVYFYQLGQKLGIDAIHRYGTALSLGRRTGIDLPGEATGVMPSAAWKQRQYRESWYPGDTISVAIGQGFLAVTPIQLAVAMSAVATSGQIPRPHLIRGDAPESTRLDVRPATFQVVREALRDAVRLGTGTRADLEHVTVAGKTGTAQVYGHSAGVDSNTLPKEERDHAWFVGYAPAEHPTIAFAVVVEHGGHGGSAAAPVARRVLEAFFGEDAENEDVRGQRRAASGSRTRDADTPVAR